MIWKIYFWASLILNFVGIVILLLSQSLAFIDIISLFWTGIMLVATYSYAYRKKLIKAKYWKWAIWFLAFLVVELLIEIFVLPPGFLEKTFPILKSNIQLTTGGLIFGLVFMFPSYYATYKLSKNKH